MRRGWAMSADCTGASFSLISEVLARAGLEVCIMLQQQAAQSMSDHKSSCQLQTGVFTAASAVCLGHPLDPTMSSNLWESLQHGLRSETAPAFMIAEHQNMQLGWWALSKDSSRPQRTQHLADHLRIFQQPAHEGRDGHTWLQCCIYLLMQLHQV